jgi:hypothetical protein
MAIGPKTVAKIAERLSEDDNDRRVIDAGWDTMGWYWYVPKPRQRRRPPHILREFTPAVLLLPL